MCCISQVQLAEKNEEKKSSDVCVIVPANSVKSKAQSCIPPVWTFLIFLKILHLFLATRIILGEGRRQTNFEKRDKVNVGG